MIKYHNDALKLALSIVPKISTVAVSMNIAIKKKYPNRKYLYDTEDKSTWIYYQNLRGERFKLPGVDGEILQPEVILNTIEDGTPITLNVENMDRYNLTRITLQEMGSYYKSVVGKYPGQELRIRSIIFGIPENTEVPDGTILLIDKKYIESNEYTLIPTLENRIKHYLSRWDVKEFILGDEEYASMLLLRLTYFIFINIINIRNGNINTLEVNTYHMNNYFNSNLRLSNLTEVLDDKVKFWLYKNLRTLMYNIGTNKTIDSILENILKPSNIEATVLDIHPIEPNWKNANDGVYKRDRIYNTDMNNKSVESILALERNDNKLDYVYKDTGYKDSIFHKVSKTHGIRENTKILLLKEERINLIYSVDRSILALESIMLYLSKANSKHEFRDISTGITYSFSSRNMIYVLLYVMNKINNDAIRISDGLYAHNTLDPLVLPSTFRNELHGDDTVSKAVTSINSNVKYIDNVIDKATLEEYIDSMIKAHTGIKYYIGNVVSTKSKDAMYRAFNVASKPRHIVLDTIEDFEGYMLNNNMTIIDSNKRDKKGWVKLLNDISMSLCNKPLVSIEGETLNTFFNLVNRLTSYSLQVLKDNNNTGSGTLINSIGVHQDIGAINIVSVKSKCGDSAPTIKKIEGNDGSLDNTLFKIELSKLQVLDKPTLSVKVEQTLNNTKAKMTVVG